MPNLSHRFLMLEEDKGFKAVKFLELVPFNDHIYVFISSIMKKLERIYMHLIRTQVIGLNAESEP